MLLKLYVQNYALIRELDVELDNGLTIITGETGAGKSILLGALSLILGSRADTSVLLDKNDKCIVEGSFRIEGYDLDDFFAANELDHEPVTTLRREINPAGKSRGFINDTPVTVNVLKELGEKLIDIHSQHQTLMLNDNSFQLSVIDSFAGNLKLAEDYKTAYRRYRAVKKDHESARERIERDKADLEYYSFQLSQLDAAKLEEGEQEELEKEQEMLNHAGEIKLGLSNASGLFSDESRSILSSLGEAKQHLSKIKDFLPGGDEISARVESSFIELADIASEIQKMAMSIDDDPGRLTRLNDRLDTIYSLCQKHRVKGLTELILKREEIRQRVKSIITSDEKMAALEKQLAEETRLLGKLSLEISGRRASVTGEVEKKITSMLRQLGMPNARFRAIISRQEELTPSGIDRADFLFSANRHVDPENLAKIASGGELSRVMLSLKSLLTRNTNLPTIIFDEIDSGVSGEVADKVGRILAEMGKYMQVINITHLPQVAARATRHYHVYKDDVGDSTVTRVRLLSPEERITEVARLLSGSEITETAVRNARELIKFAEP
jgi:DNA repair protein RecN (Recombination protein N)